MFYTFNCSTELRKVAAGKRSKVPVPVLAEMAADRLDRYAKVASPRKAQPDVQWLERLLDLEDPRNEESK